MAKRLTGYIIWQEITRAINANRVARRALQQMIDEKPGPQAMALLVAKVAAAMGENLDALNEIQQIVAKAKEEHPAGRRRSGRNKANLDG